MRKIISFDLWGTLIKSHPDFKTKRAKLFQQEYNPKSLSLYQVIQAISSIEKKCDKICEHTGESISSSILISLVLQELGNNLDDIYLNYIVSKIRDVALECPPQIFDDNTIPVLDWLDQNNYTIVSASNTGFLSHLIMDELLNKINLKPDLITFSCYSDEFNVCKPSKSFFRKLEEYCLIREPFIHVGDNFIADGGAPNPFIINSNGKTILDLKKFIEQENEKNIFSQSIH